MFLYKKVIRLIIFIFSALIISVTVSCGLLEEDDNVGVIPTIAPEFGTASPMPTFTALPSLTPIANPTATPELPLRTIVIYDDEFARGWGIVTEDLLLEDSPDLTFDGSGALKITPRVAFSRLYVVATDALAESVLRRDIIAVSFYLRSTEPIAFDDMTITAQGSNDNIYWVENDRSAITTPDVFFSETQLAFLGIGTIPADTWARLEFLPQDQQFDPVYQNFTGFYLTNSQAFLAPYYIDRVEILVVDES